MDSNGALPLDDETDEIADQCRQQVSDTEISIFQANAQKQRQGRDKLLIADRKSKDFDNLRRTKPSLMMQKIQEA